MKWLLFANFHMKIWWILWPSSLKLKLHVCWIWELQSGCVFLSLLFQGHKSPKTVILSWPGSFFFFFFWGRRSLQSNSSLYNVNTLRIRVRAVASRPPGKWCRDEYTTLSFFFSPFHWGGGREVEWPVGVATNQLEGWWSDLSSSLVLRNRLSNKLNPDFPCASVLSEYMNGK